MATATADTGYKEQVAKRQIVFTMPRDRMEIRFQSNEPIFPLRERDMGEIRAFQEEQARAHGLNPDYFGLGVPTPGLVWVESKPMHVGKLFGDITATGLTLIDAFSYMYEKIKMIRGEKVVVEMFRNVLVYQHGAEVNAEAMALAEPVIVDISKAGFEYGSVFINRNQSPETGQWWRCDTVELSAPTSRPRSMPSLRINRSSYALEASDLPPKEVKRKERTFEEWVALAVSFAQRHGMPAVTLKEWRNPEVRMAAAKELGLDPEDYRYCDVDRDGN